MDDESACVNYKDERKLQRRYMEFPVRTGMDKTPFYLYADDELITVFEIELVEPEEAAFWTYLDLKRYVGHTVRIEAPGIYQNLTDAFAFTDELREKETFYREKYRPEYHFSPLRGWINDPNGLYYQDGKFHLFFQHNPYGAHGGNLTWGHAVSRDMVHWRQLAEAVHPDRFGLIFSGSAVVDKKNATGLMSEDGKAPALLFFSYAGGYEGAKGQPFTQGMAYSLDGGETYMKHPKPIVGHIEGGNRDPYVVWCEESGKWAMVLYLEMHRYAILSSDNMIDWTFESEVLSDDNECPQLLNMPVNGDPKNRKWVFYGARSSYVVGSFDGKTFTRESARGLIGHGAFYASMTFANSPGGRFVLMPWMRMERYDMPFNQCLGIPVEIELEHTEADGYFIKKRPIKELKSLRGKRYDIQPQIVKPGENPLARIDAGEALEIEAEVSFDDKRLAKASFDNRHFVEAFGIRVRGMEVRQKIREDMNLMEVETPRFRRDEPIKLRIFADRLTLEVFGGDGDYYITRSHRFDPEDHSLEFFVQTYFENPDSAVKIEKLTVWELNSIWQ